LVHVRSRRDAAGKAVSRAIVSSPRAALLLIIAVLSMIHKARDVFVAGET
jgi:hypothetical protein